MRFLNKYIFLLILLSLFFLRPIFSSDFYISHDGVAHAARFAAYFKAFQDGQIIPRWASDLNSGYGSPLFIFFYPLSGYLASIFHLLGFDFETIFKILVSLSFTAAPIFLFLWLRTKANEGVAFVTSVAYAVLPYRILDSHVRGDIAELLSFVFIPLIFLLIDKVQKEKKLSNIIFGGFAYGLFILSHNAIALIFSPVFLAYSFIFAKKTKELVLSIYILILGLLVSLFFWFPSLLEGKYVLSKLIVEDLYKTNFVYFWNLFYSDWGFGAEISLSGGQSPQVGILYMTIPFLALLLIHKMKGKKELIFWLFVFFTSIFMTTNLSSLLWDKLPLVKLMGYPWRFISLSGFASVMTVYYFLKESNKKIIWLIMILFIITSLQFVKVRGYEEKRSDTFYNSYQGTTDYHLRTSTIWTAGDFAKPAKSQLELIGGKAKVYNFQKGSTLHSFETVVYRNAQFLDNTVYFPGWKVFIDKKETPIEFQDMNHRGLITFRVPEGKHGIAVKFEETKVRLLSDYISAIALILCLGILFSQRWIQKN